MKRFLRRLMGKYVPFAYYNHETGSYIKLYITPRWWAFGIDAYNDRDVLTINVGPMHISTAHDSNWYQKARQ